MKRAIVVLAALALVFGACTGAGASGGSGGSGAVGGATGANASVRPVDLTVFAAASLQGALGKAKAAYEAGHPGVTLTVSTGSSAALETQIEQGAPADLFLSADTANPARLAGRGLTLGEPVPFAGNALTVIVPAANPARIASPADLGRPGVKIIAAGQNVPITKYANELVANLAREPGYPADFAARYAANVASREDDVKAVVSKVELGEGDAGIVYATDAKAASGTDTVPVPASANVPATYDGVVVKGSGRPDAARAFLVWLAGPDGRAILAGFGFLAPRAAG